MNDIKIPDQQSKKTDFEVKHLSAGEEEAASAGEKVKVNFEKFVQLVATHNFEEAMKKHAEEDIILSTNLLTDLASAHEEEQAPNRKLPIIFIVGIIIGVVVTYLIIRL